MAARIAWRLQIACRHADEVQRAVDVANKRQLDEYSKSVIDIMVAGSEGEVPAVLLSNEVHDMMRSRYAFARTARRSTITCE